jgi:hypothetical protein
VISRAVRPMLLGIVLALSAASAAALWAGERPPREVGLRVVPGVYHLGSRIPLQASLPLGSPAYFLEGDLVPGADWGKDARIAEVRQSPPTSYPGALALRIEIQCFNTGTVALPPLPVTVRAGGSPEPYLLKAPPITIAALLPPGDQPRPPLAAPLPLPRPFPWGLLVGALVLLALAAAGIVWWWRRRRKAPEAPQAKPSLRETDPDRWIQEEIERLFSAPLESQVRYAALSQRVRDYLELKSGLPFLEWTTGEVRQGLHRLGNLPQGAPTDVMALLSLCDWAVFARYLPEPDEEREAKRRILGFLAMARAAAASHEEGAA